MKYRQEIREVMTSSFQDACILESRPARWRRYGRITAWTALAVIVAALATALIAADDVVAFYHQIVVRERSQPVDGMARVLERAPFQVWAPDGRLIAVQELGADATYAVISRYRWNGASEVVVMQDAGVRPPPATHAAFWDGARNVDDTIMIQGRPAVIYETPVRGGDNQVLGWNRTLVVVLNGTTVTIFGAPGSAVNAHEPLSRDELRAIGESLRPVTP